MEGLLQQKLCPLFFICATQHCPLYNQCTQLKSLKYFCQGMSVVLCTLGVSLHVYAEATCMYAGPTGAYSLLKSTSTVVVRKKVIFELLSIPPCAVSA